jgi:hypothetical protein
MSSDLMIEIWESLKPFIANKERLHAADVLVSVFDDYGYIDSELMAVGVDKFIDAAMLSHFGTNEEDEEDDGYSEW